MVAGAFLSKSVRALWPDLHRLVPLKKTALYMYNRQIRKDIKANVHPKKKEALSQKSLTVANQHPKSNLN